MFLKSITKKGITLLYFYESYYQPSKIKGEKGRLLQRSLESLGSLHDLEKLYEDPISHFTQIAIQRTKEQKDSSLFSITIDTNSTLVENEDIIKNVGYGIIKEKWVLGGGYHTDNLIDDEGNEIKFIHKSRIHPKVLNVNVTAADGKHKKKKNVSVDQKQMVYYSEKYSRKQRHDREVMVERAKDLIKYPKKYDRVTSAGSAAYIQNISFDKKTGEIVEGKELTLNTSKIEKQAKYDGFILLLQVN